MNLWHRTADPTELSVGCSGERHKMVWRNGEVELLDHPDRDAELALVGLGGAEPNCIAHLRLFEDAVSDGGFLAGWADDSGLTQAWYSWLDAALERMRTEGFHEVLRELPQSRSMRQGEFISRFPLAWLDRAAAEVSEQVLGTDSSGRASVVCADAEPNLLHAIRVRARRAFVQTVGRSHLTLGGAALVPLRIDITGNGAPQVEGRLTGSERQVVLTLDRTWLHDVWAAGASAIDDRLVVGLRTLSEPNPDHNHTDAVATWVDWPNSSGNPAPREVVLREGAVRHDGQGWAFLP